VESTLPARISANKKVKWKGWTALFFLHSIAPQVHPVNSEKEKGAAELSARESPANVLADIIEKSFAPIALVATAC
jgi:hypothetical protein